MLFAETTWADVAMEAIKFLFYLVGTCSALYVGYRQIKPTLDAAKHEAARAAELTSDTNHEIGRVATLTSDARKDVARAVEMNQANGIKLDRVETGLAQNTEITSGVAKAVNGGRTCEFKTDSATISGRMNDMQVAMVGEMKGLKERVLTLTSTVEKQTAEISELKSQLAAKG